MMLRRLKDYGTALSLLEGKVEGLSPISILKRGYSITRKLPEKKILKSVSSLAKGNRVNVLLAEGEMDCVIEKIAAV